MGAPARLHSSGRTEQPLFGVRCLRNRGTVSAANSWRNANYHGARPYVAVNLSARQFRDDGLVSKIVGAMRASGLSPGRLIIEITECGAAQRHAHLGGN
jgi:EAL domain-containing protein (putative c-di-GMP-specific phosphodiesterase class I)